jgi:hypothetical protein
MKNAAVVEVMVIIDGLISVIGRVFDTIMVPPSRSAEEKDGLMWER